MKIANLKKVVNTITSETTPQETAAMIKTAMEGETGSHWIKFANKFYTFCETMEPEFSIFAEAGNRKLPFLSFSVLPFATCPGAGDCLNFCYSQKAWRYPAAFFKQLQNTLLMNHRPETIAAEFQRVINTPKFAKQDKIDFRLYVDGDFSNVHDFSFWMSLLADNPRVSAYGYSKSWKEILEYFAAGNTAPANYVLNLSSGSMHNLATEAKMRRLPITRGQFTAVKMPGQWKQSAGHSKAYKTAARKAYGNKKAFICPLDCGNCTSKGHMCGNSKAQNIPIIVPLH